MFALGFADEGLLDAADRVALRESAGDAELASSHSSSPSSPSGSWSPISKCTEAGLLSVP